MGQSIGEDSGVQNLVGIVVVQDPSNPLLPLGTLAAGQTRVPIERQ